MTVPHQKSKAGSRLFAKVISILCLGAISANFQSVQMQDSIEAIILFSCSTQLSWKYIMLINVKMPTIVGILTFMSMINPTYESSKARKVFFFLYFSFLTAIS